MSLFKRTPLRIAILLSLLTAGLMGLASPANAIAPSCAQSSSGGISIHACIETSVVEGRVQDARMTGIVTNNGGASVRLYAAYLGYGSTNFGRDSKEYNSDMGYVLYPGASFTLASSWLSVGGRDRINVIYSATTGPNVAPPQKTTYKISNQIR